MPYPQINTLSSRQIRRVDRVAIQAWGVPGVLLMENAGRGVADLLCELGIDGLVAVVCGKGNNGGDGFVLARHLYLRGYDVCVVLACKPVDLAGDALVNFELLERSKVSVFRFAECRQPTNGSRGVESEPDWVVDCLLGTGAKGAARPPYDECIRWMNESPAKKMAVDVPSGLDAESGQPTSDTFLAEITATLVAKKIGFAKDAAKPFLGRVVTLDIGLPWELVVQASKDTRSGGTP